MEPKISILGAGSFGTALAILLARNGCDTLLWGHTPERIAVLRQSRENSRYLPGFPFPDNLTVTSDLKQAASFCNLYLIAVPSHAFKETIKKLKPFVTQDARIAWTTKGLNPDDGSFLHQVAYHGISPQTPIAIISGPTFAREIAADLPTAVTIASPDETFAAELADMLHNRYFRAYTSTDIVGVQIGGAIKNVLAIAAGIADGLGFGANTRAALITRGLAEMMRLGMALHAKQETLMGLAGLGDLVLTCTDNQSRNRRFGMALGQGQDKNEIVRQIDQEIEGISAAQEAYRLARKLEIDMPITEQTYQVLYQGL
ncbi:MAG: NAD(P)H-dependent glycerol-3-phosphate dehydrogenase, partial [Gammaproteobacteria bacterium]